MRLTSFAAIVTALLPAVAGSLPVGAAEPQVALARPPADYFAGRLQKKRLKSEGGGTETEKAVERALDWLRRHQSPDGLWRCRGYTSQCKTSCKNLNATKYGEGVALSDYDLGVSGLAILAFTGNGYSPQRGKRQKEEPALAKAAAALRKIQTHSDDPSKDGAFGDFKAESRAYEHAICTTAMAELLAISRDEALRQPVTDAVRLCLRAQNDGYGWRYGFKPGQNDTSVTGWMVLAIKTAWDAGVEIPRSDVDKAGRDALNWVNRVTGTSGRAGYMIPGDEGSRLAAIHIDPYPFSKEMSAMTAVAVAVRIFCGEDRTSQAVRDGIKILMQQPPRWQEQKGRSLSTINQYYWYYGSQALFQFGGRDWKIWNEAMKKALLETQRAGRDLCEDGSWDPIGEWGRAGGRVYSTALSALTLETYYRFERTAASRAKARSSSGDQEESKKKGP